MTGNQSGNETARNLVPENARSYVRLRSPMPGCRQDREGPVVACERSINCTSSAASSAAASASRPGSIVTKMASTLCSASATASIPAGQLASDPARAQAFFARLPTLRPRHAAADIPPNRGAPKHYTGAMHAVEFDRSIPNRRNRPPQPRCNGPAQPAELQVHARIGFLDDATLPRTKCFNGNSGHEEKPRTILKCAVNGG